MVLILYLIKRYLKYLFTINFSLTLLFNFIEFFEKTMRIQHATTIMTLNFISLNILPSFFQTLPISVWLATCLLLKELVQQDELQTCKILNINNNKILNFFIITGVFLTISSFIIKEQFIIKIEKQSEQFKLANFKQLSHQKIINKWLILSTNEVQNKQLNSSLLNTPIINNIFCYFDFLDLQTETGANIILICLTSNFEINKIIKCKNFSVNTKKQTLIFSNPTILYNDSNIENKQITIEMNLESFFSQIKLENGIPSISLLIKTLISSKNIIPRDFWNNLFYQFIKRILFHLQNLIYPILTFYFFLLFPFHIYYKWILIFLPYPLMIIIELISDIIISQYFHPLLTLFPYLILLFIVYIHHKKLEKTFY
ncbi:LptF/LptG family permease [Candidatus Dependentiae bacterium]|nr:LptF/LptG family permease [Candidatus Dependentiae bacterium]